MMFPIDLFIYVVTNDYRRMHVYTFSQLTIGGENIEKI